MATDPTNANNILKVCNAARAADYTHEHNGEIVTWTFVCSACKLMSGAIAAVASYYIMWQVSSLIDINNILINYVN